MGKHDNELKQCLSTLKGMTVKVSKLPELSEKNELIKKIQKLIEDAPEEFKGRLFEKYIAYLYEGVGYAVIHNGKKGDNGADVLLYHPDELNKVSIIVQTKNQKKPLTYKETKAELEQFEEAGCKIYNCYQYTLISINGFVKDCERLKRYNMNMVSWDYVAGLISDFKEDVLTAKKRAPRLELNAHNQVAYDEILESLNHQDVLAVVRATGTGKSYLISELLYDYNDKKKLVLAPSHHILKDLKKKFHLGNKDNFDDLTYQKLINMKEEDFSNLKAELIIFDEFHRLGAEKWGEYANKLKLQNPGVKIVGFSATPVRFLDGNRDMVEEFFDGQKIKELELAEAIVRRILPTPTYISSLYTLEEELKRYEEKIDRSFISHEETKQAKQALKKIAQDWESTYGVDKILAKYLPRTNENMKFIIFCENIPHLNTVNIEVQKWFNKALNDGEQKQYKNIRPYRIHSKMSGKKKELERFESNEEKNTVDLLFSVDMFNEGLHVKGITGVVLLRTTSSPTIYYQQIGRALAVGNQDPLIFDLVNNFDSLKVDDGYHFGRALEKASKEESDKRESDGLPANLPKVEVVGLLEDCKRLFKDINQYLRNSWNFRYQQLKKYHEKHQHSNVPQEYEENPQLANWIGTQRTAYKSGKLSQERIDLLNELNFCWDINEAKWIEMYYQLKEYYSKYRHCNIDQNGIEGNKKLIEWARAQRRLKQNGTLLEERINLLNELDFVWNTREYQWMQSYQKLKLYFNKYRHSNVTKDGTKETEKLLNWTKVQRRSYMKKTLSQERITLLNELNFIWNEIEYQWMMMYQQLKDYYNENQHCNVPQKQSENKELGTWVSTQRYRYAKKILAQERIDLLNALDFIWNAEEANWLDKYQQLKIYFEKHQHSTVINDGTKEIKKIIDWQCKQRRYYKEGSLSQERIALLNELNFIWNPYEVKWLEKYMQLKEYYSKYQNCNVPHKCQENPQLGSWIQRQRQSYKKGQLSRDKIDLLNQLNFDWRV